MKGKQIVHFLAYISIALIATALFLSTVFKNVFNPAFIGALELIAQIIAYSITAVFAFMFAKSKRSIGWMVAYIIFVVAIIVFLILAVV